MRIASGLAVLLTALVACTSEGPATEGSGGGGGATSSSGGVVTAGSTTGGFVPSDPVTPEEILARFAGEFADAERGTQLRGCVLDAPEVGEHVVYVARGQLAEGAADRQLLLALDPTVVSEQDGETAYRVSGHFFPLEGSAPWSCEEAAAAVLATPPVEKVGCSTTFRRDAGEDPILGHRNAVGYTQEEPDGEACFPVEGLGNFFRWELRADGVTWRGGPPSETLTVEGEFTRQR